jgi:hypothetical protein
MLTSSSICLRHHGCISNDKFIKLIIHLVRHWDIQRRTTKSPFSNYVHPETR